MLTKNEEFIIECFRKDPEKVLEAFKIIVEERKASSSNAPAPQD